MFASPLPWPDTKLLKQTESEQEMLARGDKVIECGYIAYLQFIISSLISAGRLSTNSMGNHIARFVIHPPVSMNEWGIVYLAKSRTLKKRMIMPSYGRATLVGTLRFL